jgi:hypothetical protein
MHIIRLTASDRSLLCARWSEHDNSQRRMMDSLGEAGAVSARGRLAALRCIEKRFDLDLAEICFRFGRRLDEQVHPIERLVVEFITEERRADGEVQLWILPDRVRQVRELMDGKLVGDLES